MRLEQQLGLGRNLIQIYFSPYDDALMTGFPGAGRHLNIEPLNISSGPRGLKLFEGEHSTPLIRVDYPKHGKNPPLHLQYGGDENEGYNPKRNGQEAGDIFAQILLTTKHPLNFSWENEEDENKD